MAYLQKEPNIFPLNLLEDPCYNNERAEWWFVYTKSRQEKVVARALFALQLPFFLPLEDNKPVYTCCLFVASEEARVAAFITGVVVDTKWVPDQVKLIQDLLKIHHQVAR